MRKIALEEHCMVPGLASYWEGTMADVPKEIYDRIRARLFDYGEMRLREMDEAGIGKSILSVAGPGVQVEPSTATALKTASEANDHLAAQIAPNKDRLYAFAHIALQDANAAAKELERCVKQLGFKGALINGHSLGHYLDERQFDPFWAKAEELQVPVYLHPADPPEQYKSFDGYDALRRATWGWTVETGTHVLRMVFGGVFDRFPKAILAVGHLGETMPFLLWRLDSRAKLYGVKLKREPSDYIRENMYVTLSGMYSAEPLNCSIAALGQSRVMFSADYPFENWVTAGKFMDDVAVPENVRADVGWNNAAKLFHLA
ncbi:amidohydrolase family protein [Methylocella sp. CPCC 101449]|uniref:amidohydrolase family protein n=1 Tax=Methylocella sp. CPCC 101449 TaxID=2987531 RepID=UPI0028917BF2|nr:amidohydrolase family protein [Methylocella sp. CPCC 101449]MDT2022854.1 amidohydrolase family protein [Methylocella sp. CPCC 101449]